MEVVKGGSPSGGKRLASMYEASFPASTGETTSPVHARNQSHPGQRPVKRRTSTGARAASQDVRNASEKTTTTPFVSDEEFGEEFDAVWNAYPYQVDRGKALGEYASRRRAGADPQDLLAATRHYSTAVKGTEARFIKRASNFFGPKEPFSDYISGVPGTDRDTKGGPERDRIAESRGLGRKYAEAGKSLETCTDLLQDKNLSPEEIEAALAGYRDALAPTN